MSDQDTNPGVEAAKVNRSAAIGVALIGMVTTGVGGWFAGGGACTTIAKEYIAANERLAELKVLQDTSPVNGVPSRDEIDAYKLAHQSMQTKVANLKAALCTDNR